MPKDCLPSAPGAIQGQVLIDNSPGLLDADAALEGFHCLSATGHCLAGAARKETWGRPAAGRGAQGRRGPPLHQGGVAAASTLAHGTLEGLTGCEVRGAGVVGMQPSHVAAVGLETARLFFLSLSFLVCKMGSHTPGSVR